MNEKDRGMVTREELARLALDYLAIERQARGEKRSYFVRLKAYREKRLYDAAALILQGGEYTQRAIDD